MLLPVKTGSNRKLKFLGIPSLNKTEMTFQSYAARKPFGKKDTKNKTEKTFQSLKAAQNISKDFKRF